MFPSDTMGTFTIDWLFISLRRSTHNDRVALVNVLVHDYAAVHTNLVAADLKGKALTFLSRILVHLVRVYQPALAPVGP